MNRVTDAGRWNHNIHYHRVILDALGPRSGSVLDVGCGVGVLSRRLLCVAERVTGIDRDPASINLARDGNGEPRIDYLLGDFLTHPFPPESFDAVVSVAALHHMDAAAALGRMGQLLRPSGKLAIVGLARSRIPTDLPLDLAAVSANSVLKAHHGYWNDRAPKVWPPPATYAQMRELAAELLPGVRYRRHLLWRYSLVWTKPVVSSADRRGMSNRWPASAA